MTKLQRYAASLVKDKEHDIIQSKGTNSVYYDFNGNRVRLSDHLPAEANVEKYGMALSIISTEEPNTFVLQRECSGFLTVITYRKAQEILRSFLYISNILPRPSATFRMEKEFYEEGIMIKDIPNGTFTREEKKIINNILGSVRTRMTSKAAKNETKEKKMPKI